MKFAASLAFAAAALITTAAQAQTTDVKIGVLTDMSSLYSDATAAGLGRRRQTGGRRISIRPPTA